MTDRQLLNASIKRMNALVLKTIEEIRKIRLIFSRMDLPNKEALLQDMDNSIEEMEAQVLRFSA